MPAYQRRAQRFFFTGISLLPADGMPAGKLPFVQNMRSYKEGVLTPRDGLFGNISAPYGVPIHSLGRLNDPTPYAGAAAKRYLGVGADLRSGNPGASGFNVLDTGYSGDPLSFLAAVPVASPQPWMYVADRSRMRKTNTNGLVYPIGIAPPLLPITAPTVTYSRPAMTILSEMNATAGWAPVGAIAGAASLPTRINTTIAQIVYDASNFGYGSISPAAMTSITEGTRVTLQGSEIVVVTQILIPVATTTIAAIIYDSGTTGLCTIQPTASLGTGQLEGPSLAEYYLRYHPQAQLATPPPVTGVQRLRQIDFPVNCLVTLNGSETTRIQSVAMGPDGVQSFRCSTAGTFAAGQSIAGLAGFRCYMMNARAIGDTITAENLQQTITTVSVDPVVAGLNSAGTTANLALLSDVLTAADIRASLPDDDLHLAINVDLLSYITAVRIYLSCDAAGPTYLNNYFFHEWRANDIISAIQATNAGVIAPIQTARETAVLNEQVNQSGEPMPPSSPPPEI